VHPGQEGNDLVQHADDERQEAAGNDQDAETDGPAIQFAGCRPDSGDAQHEQGENAGHHPHLPVAVGGIGLGPPALALQAQGQAGEGDAGNRRRQLARPHQPGQIEDHADAPHQQGSQNGQRKPPAGPGRIAGRQLEHRHHDIGHRGKQHARPARQPPAGVEVGEERQRQGPAFSQGQGHEQAETDHHGQAEQGELDAADTRAGGGHAKQGTPHDDEKQEDGQAEQQRTARQRPGQAEPEAANQQQAAAGQADMHGAGKRQRPWQIGAGNNRQNLDQGAEHDLQHEADGQQVGGGQGAWRPSRGEDDRPLDHQQQAGQHGEQRRRQEKAQGGRERWSVFEGKHGLPRCARLGERRLSA